MTKSKRTSQEHMRYPCIINRHNTNATAESLEMVLTPSALCCLFLEFVTIRYPWRNIIVMTVMVEFFILLLLLFISPSVTRLNIPPTDQDLICLKSTSIFCEKLSFYSPNKLSVYNVFGDIKIDNKTRYYSWTKTRFLSTNNLWTEQFHFIEGSDVNVTVDSDFKLKFRVIEGGVELPASQIKECDQKQQSDFCQTIRLTVSHSEEVEFISADNPSPTFADINYSFNRTSYDVTDAVKSCKDVNFCEIPLMFSSHSIVVVGSGINGGEITPVRVQCQIRLICVVSIFHGLLLFLFMFGLCFRFFHRNGSRRDRDYFSPNESHKEIVYGTFDFEEKDTIRA